MKTKQMISCLAVLGLTALMATSCLKSTIHLGKGLSNRIEPSDKVVEKVYDMKAFDQMEVTLIGQVKIMQSDSDGHRVVLRCPENYVELFDFKVEEGKLKLDFTETNVTIETADMRILVYTPSLRSIENDGVANITTDALRADLLEVENDGVGSIKLKGLNVRHIDCELNGVGNIHLEGTASEASLENNGVGAISAEELKAAAVRAEVSGVGSVKCWADEKLKAEVSGVGSLKYGGDPKEKKLERSGVGSIGKL